MLKDGKRICDVCVDKIPKGTKYCVSMLPSEAAAILFGIADKELMGTWTQYPDGRVRLDICVTCYLSMGTVPAAEEIS